MRGLRRILCGLLVVLAIMPFARPARAVSDPRLLYQTIDTPHFRVTYYSQTEPVARRVADVAESIYEEMALAVGHHTTERTEILLTDPDGANGSASAIPYNAVRLYVTAPDDMSPLADVDDWYLALVTHEYTHVLHTGQTHGIPAIMNAVLGKTMAPNQVQPRWLLEGLAVHHESARTSGGRLRSAIWDMYMRTDVIEDNVATLDQMSNMVRRWPQGNLWYLYGSQFVRWISDTYGEDALRRMTHDYGGRLVPWGINRSARRATGHTFEELYPAWVESMKRRYDAQLRQAGAGAGGFREGVRLTHSGQIALYPRLVPPAAWREHQGKVIYFRDDGVDRVGYWALPLVRDARGVVTGAVEKERRLVARTNGDSYGDFSPGGAFLFSSTDVYNSVFTFDDLFTIRSGLEAPDGYEPGRTRLTEGFRAKHPSVSPDGRRVVFVTNHRGTRHLRIADVLGDPARDIANTRSLVPSEPFEQMYTPRWSPDGTRVAVSWWTRGGYRDIRVVDVASGTWVEIAHDRAQDGAPSWSPDGRYVLFHSDRTGIYNLFAWEVATGRLFQVTNVRTGAFDPEPSPDGKTLIYVGYTKKGFDLFAMPFSPEAFVPAEAYVDDRPSPPIVRPGGPWVPRPYAPLQTLLPRRYSVSVAPGVFGEYAASVLVAGSDIASLHTITASATTELERPEVQGVVSYAYARQFADVAVSAYRNVTPRYSYRVGKATAPAVQENTGVTTALAFPIPGEFEAQNLAISYSLGRIAGDQPMPLAAINPYDTPTLPFRGMIGSVHLGYTYTNVERYPFAISADRGMTFTASMDITDPWLASDFAGWAVSTNLTRYVRVPFVERHVLALHGGAGMAGGSFPGHSAFYNTGYVDLPIADVLRNQLIQGGFTLRGYSVVAAAGRMYALTNTEYRFPIVNVDRGMSTLPAFLNRVSGTLYADWGTAFDDANLARFKLGTGAEIVLETLLGYYAPFTFRTGFVRGWHSGGLDKVYFVAAVPF